MKCHHRLKKHHQTTHWTQYMLRPRTLLRRKTRRTRSRRRWLAMRVPSGSRSMLEFLRVCCRLLLADSLLRLRLRRRLPPIRRLLSPILPPGRCRSSRRLQFRRRQLPRRHRRRLRRPLRLPLSLRRCRPIGAASTRLALSRRWRCRSAPVVVRRQSRLRAVIRSMRCCSRVTTVASAPLSPSSAPRSSPSR